MMYDVSVIIPTFRRPHLLEKTLRSVARQRNELNLEYEIVVVDNSPERSAEDTVRRLTGECAVPVRFVSEPRQNIALARNAGIDHSDAEFIAMIDDDEQAAADWLDQLVSTIRKFDADAVAGPTFPIFEQEVPAWIGEKWYRRDKDVSTGTVLRMSSTAQLLLRSATCLANNNRFDPELGRSGGSDTEFTMRLVKRMGRKIVWCREAIVEEFIPMSRVNARYLLRRALRSNQGFVFCSVKYSDHPIRTAAYFMFVVGLAQIAVWLIPSLVLRPSRSPYAMHARAKLIGGIGKLFWSRSFRFNFY